MQQATTAATGSWADVFLGFGKGLADTLTETASIAAQAKIQKELERAGLLEQQRINDSTTNQDLLFSLSPVTGTNADGSTIVERTVSFGGVTVQSNTLKTIGFAVAALLAGAVAVKYIKG